MKIPKIFGKKIFVQLLKFGQRLIVAHSLQTSHTNYKLSYLMSAECADCYIFHTKQLKMALNSPLPNVKLQLNSLDAINSLDERHPGIHSKK